MTKKLKIGIYETSHSHQAFLYNLIRLLNPDVNDVHLFLSPHIYKLISKIDSEMINKTIVHINYSKHKFIFNIFVSKYTQNLDIFIACSLGGNKWDYLSFLFLLPQCKYILVDSHYGNTFLNISGWFSEWNRILKFVIINISKFQIKKADKLIYHSRGVIQQIKNYTNKPLMFLPFTLFDEYNKKLSQTSEKIIFTITGGIEKKRKDYSILFPAIEQLLEYDPDLVNKFSVVFLGTIKYSENIYGISVINNAKKINNKYGKIINYFDDFFIPEEIYKKTMHQTDIIINTINLNYYKFGIFCSGLCESISNSIPGIYPFGYDVVDELFTSSLFYKSSDDLVDIMRKIVDEPEFIINLKAKSIKNSKKISIKNYRSKLLNFISEESTK